MSEYARADARTVPNMPEWVKRRIARRHLPPDQQRRLAQQDAAELGQPPKLVRRVPQVHGLPDYSNLERELELAEKL